MKKLLASLVITAFALFAWPNFVEAQAKKKPRVMKKVGKKKVAKKPGKMVRKKKAKKAEEGEE